MTHADTLSNGLTAFHREHPPRNCFHPLITFKFTHTHYKSVKTSANLRSGLDNHKTLTSLLLYACLGHTSPAVISIVHSKCTIQDSTTILYCNILYYTISYCTVLYYTRMLCTVINHL